MENEWFDSYRKYLIRYLEDQDERALDHARELSQAFIGGRFGIEDTIAMHVSLMEEREELPTHWKQSLKFLMEFVAGFGAAFREREALILNRAQLMEELTLAAEVQKSLLPDLDELDMPSDTEVGIVSVAARQVSGDFYNILPSERGVKFLVADVAGKSMPAAILMSTIKFTMDSLLVHSPYPHKALQALNRFVVRNSEASMFITMFWGKYWRERGRLYYSSAGHEPALFYKHRTGQLRNLNTDGAALGVSMRATYRTQSVKMEPGDFVLLYTDGVIETRDRTVVDNNRKLRRWLREMDLAQSAQDIVEALRGRLAAEQGPEVPDDQTLLMFRIK